MAAHRHIDRICAVAAALSLLVTLLFLNGEALGIQAAAQVMGYEAKLFDTARVHTIDIVIDDWDGFLETCEDEEYTACAVVVDGEAYKNVGLRAKGNTSLSTVSQLGSDRYSFKIEFDCYDSGKTYYGLDKLCLNNIIQDNTYMKDYLTYQLMAGFGAAAPLCSYVYITVNGEDWGLYLAVEGIEDGFLQRNYGSGHGELYKPDSLSFGGGRGNGREFDMDGFMGQDGGGQERWAQGRPEGMQQPDGQGQGQAAPDGMQQPDGQGQGQAAPDGMQQPDGQFPGGIQAPGSQETVPEGGFDFGGMGSSDVKLQYIDDDPDSYANIFDSAKTNVSDGDKARLIQALKALGEGDAENALDIDQVLRYLVVHNFVVNGDSYTGSMVHNYYLYEQDGRLAMLPWDYNLAFGTFQGGDASGAVNDPIDTPLSVTGDGDRPMADWVFSSEEYTQLYHQYFQQFLDSADCAAIIEQAYDLIAPYVERDPTKFCTYEEFEAGVSALKTFCALRAESVSGQLSGAIPSTDAGQSADPSALVDASALTLSDMGTMNAGGRGGFGMGQDGEAVPAFGAMPGGLGQAGEGEGTASPWQGGQRPDDMAGGRGGLSGGAPSDGSQAAGIGGWLLLGVSALVLLGGLLVAFRFRR